MEPRRPEFVPDPSLSRTEMEALQDEIAATAVFEDDFAFDPDGVRVDEADTDTAQTDFGDLDARDGAAGTDRLAPVVAGVDQAFLDERAVSAVVAMRAGEVVERTHAVTPLEFPYVPGLLSFREGGSIVAAFERLGVDPDLVVFDGSGRIHFRQAGIATHMGVTFDVPAVGAAKSLLCGRPRESVDALPAGARVAIEADGDVTAPAGTLLGYAVQTRQYENSRTINPLYVSAGHRVSAETAATVVERLCSRYKLPEPVRLADGYADEAKREAEQTGGT